MTLTQKEHGLLKDAKGQEELCIAKYQKYSEMAKATELKALFASMAQVEQNHLQTVTSMMNGTVPQPAQKLENSNNNHCTPANYATAEDRKSDALLCQDMLSTEKHVSALYDTSIFEFSDPQARQVLNHIQAEEQQHGEQLYAYMNCNQMYS
jgi:rubrerythrin